MHANSDCDVDELWDAQRVAARLAVKVATVYAAAADGRIPCVRLWEGHRRGLVRFRREDVEKLIRERTVGVRA
jgi:excisionase family DNA binding protein